MKIQTFCKNIGDQGSLALCYLYIACLYVETTWNDYKVLPIIERAMELGYLGEDCFVRNPVGLMRLAVGGSFTVRKSGINDSRGEYVAVRYERTDDNGKKNSHWAVWDKAGLVWDSLDHSPCVVDGQPVFTDVRDVVML